MTSNFYEFLVRANDLANPDDVDSNAVDDYGLLQTKFDKYTVYGCKITVTFINDSDFSKMAFIEPLNEGETATTFSNWSALQAEQGVKSRLVRGGGAGNNKVTLSLYRSTQSITQHDILEEDLSANYNASTPGNSPTKKWRFRVGIMNPTGPTTSYKSLTNIVVKTTYYAKLFSPDS